MKSGTRHSEVGFTFTGDDVFMGDYLRSELLDRVSDAEASFLTRTSVLDRMCGPLCDAILGEKGSGRVLEQMESRNLLVVPLDRRREWYRYHHLLRELLQAELQRREPDLVQDLHFRAAAWFEANAMPEAAIEHAQAAGDYDRVARLVLELAAARLGQRARRDSAALDGVAQGRDGSRALRRDRRARFADLRAARPAGRGRALGGRRGTCVPGGDPPGREHDGRHAGLPARDLVPQRRRRDAARCADRLGRAEPGEPVPGDDAVHRGHFLPAGGRPDPG